MRLTCSGSLNVFARMHGRMTAHQFLASLDPKSERVNLQVLQNLPPILGPSWLKSFRTAFKLKRPQVIRHLGLGI